MGASVAGDMASRPNWGLGELDFVFATLVVGSIINFALMWLLAPTASAAAGGAASMGFAQRLFTDHYLAAWGAPGGHVSRPSRPPAPCLLPVWWGGPPKAEEEGRQGIAGKEALWRAQGVRCPALPCTSAQRPRTPPPARPQMFQPGFGLGARLVNFAYKGAVFALIGLCAGLVGTAMSNGLLALRKKLDPSYQSQVGGRLALQ